MNDGRRLHGHGVCLTLAMREEVVSERGGGPGVTIFGAHTVTAKGGAELLHACQSLCKEGGMGGQTPQDQATEVDRMGRRQGARRQKKGRYRS